MIRLFFFCFVLLIFGAPARANEGCELKKVLSVESKPDRLRHLFLPVTLMDRETHLMLDTGGAWSVLNEAFAKSLQLPVKRLGHHIQFYDAVGGQLDSYVRVPSMKIAGFQMKRAFDFILVDRGASPSYTRDAGTMGMNFFQGLDIEIDHAKNEITLFLPRDCEGGGVHWADESAWFPFKWNGGIPVVRMQIDGEDINAVVDTGSTVTLIDLDFVRRHFDITPESPGVTKLGSAKLPSGRSAAMYGYTFKTLTVSGVVFENVPARLVDLHSGIGQLILGMNELRFLHLYIATKEKMIYVTAADTRREEVAVMGLSAPTGPRVRLLEPGYR
jgi:predicted aspartyl protease